MDVSLANLDTASSVQMVVAKKQLDAARDQGAAMVALIESAAPEPASHGSVSAAVSSGHGGLDLYA